MELLVEREAYQWFRARVQEALDDDRPDIEDTEVSTWFAELRANVRQASSQCHEIQGARMWLRDVPQEFEPECTAERC